MIVVDGKEIRAISGVHQRQPVNLMSNINTREPEELPEYFLALCRVEGERLTKSLDRISIRETIRASETARGTDASLSLKTKD